MNTTSPHHTTDGAAQTTAHASWRYDPIFRRVSCGDGSVLECSGTDTETAAEHLRLASSAPALLESCISALNGIGGDDASQSEALQKARAAIALATGKGVTQ